MAEHPLPQIDPGRGLALIDVDEVIALFVQGFDRFLRGRGHELRMTSFALFANIFPAGSAEPAECTVGKAFYDEFFASGCGEIEPAPGAVQGLAALSRSAQVVILSNAPAPARTLRGDWLKRHGMDYPLVLNEGPKGPAVAELAKCTRAPVMFVDDLLPQLDSVAEAAAQVHRFQMVADPLLRPLAPCDPARHPRVDDWCDLVRMAEETVFPGAR